MAQKYTNKQMSMERCSYHWSLEEVQMETTSMTEVKVDSNKYWGG